MCEECGCGRIERFGLQAMQDNPRQAVRLIEGKAPTPKSQAQAEGPDRYSHSHVHAHGGHEHEHVHEHLHGHDHAHDHEHHHHHHHSHDHGHVLEHSHGPAATTFSVHQSILSHNDRLAERNRGFFRGRGLLALNIVSSPGAGKTALIERTVQALGERCPVVVIVGDLETAHDASRIRQSGAAAVQVTTGTVCHLDAEMVARGLEELPLAGARLLIIENVGNLVCPASFDLGEDLRVVMLSTTEGEDKPLKYPPLFRSADVVVVSKMDLAEAVGFNRQLAMDNIRKVAPQAKIVELSAKAGTGLDAWVSELEARMTAVVEELSR